MKKKKGKLIKIIEDLTNKIIEKYIREKKCTCSLVDKKRKKQTTTARRKEKQK